MRAADAAEWHRSPGRRQILGDLLHVAFPRLLPALCERLVNLHEISKREHGRGRFWWRRGFRRAALGSRIATVDIDSMAMDQERAAAPLRA